MLPIVQQRLIGSILLLCVLGGVAFFLIDSATDDIKSNENLTTDIPFVSSIDAIVTNDVSVIDADPEVFIDAQSMVKEDLEPAVISESVIEPKSQKPDPVPAPLIVEKQPKISITTWSLQLASLADSTAAETLRKRVELLGYKASVIKAETTKGPRFRVRIGPEQDKLALEAIAKQIENKLNLKPLMLKQLPE